MTTVVSVSWAHDSQPLAASAGRIAELHALLVATFPALAGMLAEPREGGKRVSFAEPAACEALLLDGAVKHDLGPRAGEALTYHLVASLGRGEWPLVSLGVNLATGLSELLDPFAPANSVVLTLHDFAASLSELEQMFRILLRVFPSPWGYVGSDIIPSQSVDGQGVPLVGWLTYLRRDYGRPGPDKPEGVDVQVTEGGRIIRAFDGPPNDESLEHVERIEAVREWLLASGMLRSYADLVANPYVEPEAPKAPKVELAPESEPAPVVAPAHVAAPAMVAAPPVQAMLETAPGRRVALPFASHSDLPEALPFVAGDGRAPAPIASSLEPNAALGGTAGPSPTALGQAVTPFRSPSSLEPHLAMGATVAAASHGAEQATSFHKVELPMSLSKLVELGVALTVHPQNRAAILTEHGLDEAGLESVSQTLQTAMAQDPNLSSRYHSLYERMMGAELAKPRGD